MASHALIFAAVGVLGNLRSAIIVGATIPFALFFAIGILRSAEPANLLSVGAIDFGLIVDANAIMVRVFSAALGGRRILRASTDDAGMSPDGLSGAAGGVPGGPDVNRSIFAGIIIAGFIPLFTLSGVSHIFGPRPRPHALAGGLIANFTVMLALSAVPLPEHVHETETRGAQAARNLYASTTHATPTRSRYFPARLYCWRCPRSDPPLGLEFLPSWKKAIFDLRHHAPTIYPRKATVTSTACAIHS